MKISLSKIKKMKYWGQWKAPALAISVWGNWASTEFYRTIKLPQLPHKGDTYILDGHHFIFKDDCLLADIAYQLARKHDIAFWNRFYTLSDRARDRFSRFTEDISKKRNFLNPAEELQEFFILFREIITPWTMVFYFSDGIERYVLEKMTKMNISHEQLSFWSHPARKNLLIKQQKEAVQLLSELKKNNLLSFLKMPSKKAFSLIQSKHPSLARKIEKHISRYEWVGTHHFWGKPLTIERLFKEMEGMLHEKVFTKEPAVPAQLQSSIKILQELAYYRLLCAEITDRGSYIAKNLFTSFAKHYKFPEEYIIWMTIDELNAIGVGRKKPISQAEFKERKKAFGRIVLNGKEKIILGKELQQLIERLLGILSPVRDEIKGISVSRGVVRGVVRVVITPADSEKLKNKEVLVCPETTPDFVPAMRRSIAIITDVGGITSHAAIVSREFNIPCIVGTQFATRVLRDGDLVEVDASVGVVRVLKRKN